MFYVLDRECSEMGTQTKSYSTQRELSLRRKLHATRVARDRHKKTITTLRLRCRKLQTSQRCQRSVNVETVINDSRQFLKPESYDFLASQLRLSACKPKGRRYSVDMKLMALSLHNFGARAYRFLSRIIALPSKTSLCLWLHSLPCEPGFNEEILSTIGHKVQSMAHRDRVCSLMIDEMSLKSGLVYDSGSDAIVGYEDFGSVLGRRDKIVTSALVFMLRGLASNWKQPLSYFLTSSTCKMTDVKQLLFACLSKIHDLGLIVKVVISDQGSNFQQLAGDLGINTSYPYFKFSGRKYYYMFDPPHLLKSIRNNLFKHTFIFGEKQASWSEIGEFFNIDSKQKFRLAPRLTKKHIELPAFSKMKVKLATQVLSWSVAAGLETHAAVLGSDALSTAEFVQKFDEIFDAVNSSQVKCEKPLKCAMSADTEHVSFFQNALKWLSSLKVIDKTGKDKTQTIKCIKGWQISINAIISLWNELQEFHDFSFLYTRRLNQDPLENTFSVIRQKGGNCDHPTAGQFRHLFKQVCCSRLLQPGENANCEIDIDKLLGILRSVHHKKSFSFSRELCSVPKTSENVYVPISPADDLLEDNGLYYVCGYLARKLSEWHQCSDCAILFYSPSYGSKGLLTDLKNYSRQKAVSVNSLFTVSDDFYVYVQCLENIFTSVFEEFKCSHNVVKHIANELMVCETPVTCSRFPLLKFIHFFARLRINYTLKFGNEKLASDSKAKRKNNKLKKIKH